MHRHRPELDGFTLIELLVVIAIIGLLSSIVLASLNSARTKGQDAARISNVKSIETAMEMYYDNNGGYPTSNNSANGDVLMSDPIIIGKLVPQYLGGMPAQLIADGDHYYSAGVTTGVSGSYDMLIYTAKSGWCRAGTMSGSTGDWGVPAVCNF